MAYILLSQSFGLAKANLPVTITEATTGVPAVLLSSPTGGLVSTTGDTKLDASGNLSVYVDGAFTWSVSVDSGASGAPVGTLLPAQVGAGAIGIPGIKADGTLITPAGATIGLTSDQQSKILTAGVSTVPMVVNVTRNSLNDATDINEVVMATFVIPAGTLRVGSSFDIIGLYENTSSGNSKIQIVRMNGTSIGGGGTFNSTNQSFGIRWAYNVHDSTTILWLNNGSIGVGAGAPLLATISVGDIATTPITITLAARWASANIAGEFIRLKHAKLWIAH